MITYSATNCVFPAVRLAQFTVPACTACVSCASYVSLSVPFPSERRYRLRVLWTDPTPEGHWLSYLSFRICLPPHGGTIRVSQVLVRFSRHMPRFFVNPGRPSENSPNRSLRVGFQTVNTVAICTCAALCRRRNNEAISRLQEVRTSLWPMSFPVYASMMLFGRWCQKFVSLFAPQPCGVSRLVEVAGIPSSTPRFSLFDGHFSNRT